MSELSISFDGRDPAEVVLAKTEVAMHRGASSIWLACHLFQRDPISTAGVLLSRFPGMKIVLVALSPYVLHPVYIAMAAATLNEFFPGRISLCLGVGAPADLANAGIASAAPLGTMREAIQVCRALFAGETVRIDGKRFQVRDQSLAAGRQDVAILLAASGPKMLRLAGSEADGVVLSAGTSVEFVGWCLEQVESGSVSEIFQRHAFVYAAVSENANTAYDGVRRSLAHVLQGGHHARNLECAGNRLDQNKVSMAIAAGDMARAESYISDRIVETHSAAGSPEIFRSRLEAYRAVGIDNLVLSSVRTPEQVEAVLSAAIG